ncbi:MAG: glycosyltransferase [Bacteroidota bacterium]
MPHPPYILWLASWYPSDKDPFLGDFIQRSARALATQIPVHVLYVVKDAATKKVRESVIVTGALTETIIYCPAVKTGFHSVDKVLALLHLARLAKKKIKTIVEERGQGQQMIVDVQVAMRAGLLALWMKKKWGIPFSITEHWAGYYREIDSPDQRRSRFFWTVTARIFKKASFFQPVTNHLGETVSKTVFPVTYRTVPNVVDTTVFKYDPSWGKPAVFSFVHVSTLGYQKNILGILEVVEKILSDANTPRFNLRLVGPAPAEVKERVEGSVVLKSSVSFAGELPHHLVATELKQAHAMLMFSRYENLPCVILEALCCGLPVIATRVGGIHEHIHSHNGFLVENGDKPGLEQTIIEMITSYQRFDLQQIATVAASKYNYETVGKMILANYKEFFPDRFLDA